jgi:superfamily II DNA or RNA helicase
MRLRPRQKLFVERSLSALGTRANTLGIAPTGAGKTIMLSAVTGASLGDSASKACVLAHRDELTAQNRDKFRRVVPGVSTSVVDATTKSWDGQVTFAMVPTLARQANLAGMPKLDLLVIDEAHHAVADSYRRIVDRVREANPDARVFGVTATPNRGDKKGLREVFDNVADQVRLGELIASGHRCRPGPSSSMWASGTSSRPCTGRRRISTWARWPRSWTARRSPTRLCATGRTRPPTAPRSCSARPWRTRSMWPRRSTRPASRRG